MKLVLLAVGKARPPLADAIHEYEARIARYYPFDVVEVKETSGRSLTPTKVVEEEGERLLARLPRQAELVALHRPGEAWSSERLAAYLADESLRGTSTIAFAIGGAFGLAPDLVARSGKVISLSAMTFPHELARLVLAEQLYRAATILRGEPYHKGPQS